MQGTQPEIKGHALGRAGGMGIEKKKVAIPTKSRNKEKREPFFSKSPYPKLVPRIRSLRSELMLWGTRAGPEGGWWE